MVRVRVGSTWIVLAGVAADVAGGVVSVVVLAGAAKNWVRNEKLSANFSLTC